VYTLGVYVLSGRVVYIDAVSVYVLTAQCVAMVSNAIVFCLSFIVWNLVVLYGDDR
jgi:hypothetical protein